jgi:hypothetical protein
VILIQGDSPIERWQEFSLKSPDRIVLDLYNCEYPVHLRPKKRKGRFVNMLRVGRHRDRIRIVADLIEGPKVQRHIHREGSTLSLYIGIGKPHLTYIKSIVPRVSPEGDLDMNIGVHKKTTLLYKAFSLSGPNRLVLDLPNTVPGLEIPKEIDVEGVEEVVIRVGVHPRFTRIVVDLGSRPVPEYRIIPEAKGVRLSLQFPRTSPEALPPVVPEEEIKIMPPEEPKPGVPAMEKERPPEPELPKEEVSLEPRKEEEAPASWEEIEKGSTFEFRGVFLNKYAEDVNEETVFEDDRVNHAKLKVEAIYQPKENLQLVLGLEADHFAYGNDGDWDYDYGIRPYNTYINWAGSESNVKAGYQIVRWGKSDGFSPLDNINPEDFRDGFAGRREDRKFAIPMLNLELYRDIYTLQGIFIPFFYESKLDLFGTDWALFDHADQVLGPIAIVEEDPSNTLSNSEVGIRFSGILRNFDYAFSYFYTRQDTPSIGSLEPVPGFPVPSTSSGLGDLLGYAQATGQTIRLIYDRHHIWGFEFETTLGEFGLRGDLAYEYQTSFLNTDLRRIKKPTLEYMVGADYNGPGAFYVNLQFSQNFILDYEDNILFDSKITNSVNGSISKEFFAGKTELAFRFFYNITDESYLLDPRFLIKYWDNFRLTFGAEFFGGPEYTILGMLKDNDQVYLLMELNF